VRAIVLAGGKGTRLRPFTTSFPKPLMPVGDVPILEILLRQLKAHGVNHITVLTGHLAYLIEGYFTDGSPLGLHIDYLHEEEPLGTAGPLRHAWTGHAAAAMHRFDQPCSTDHAALAGLHERLGNLAGAFNENTRRRADGPTL